MRKKTICLKVVKELRLTELEKLKVIDENISILAVIQKRNIVLLNINLFCLPDVNSTFNQMTDMTKFKERSTIKQYFL